MASIDRIFVVMASLALIVYLIARASSDHRADIPDTRVGVSIPTHGNPRGQAYLVANLPLYRDRCDVIQSISIGRDNATSTAAAAV